MERLAAEDLLGPGGTRVIILTTFDLDDYVDRALRAGAAAFLLKTLTHEQLVAAVRSVAGGEAMLAPSTTRRLISRYLDHIPYRDPGAARRLDDLTARETDVLRSLARGRSNAEIAGELFITVHTVKTHVARLLAKTGARDRTQAVILAYDAGLVAPGA
ncbi:response regulator transcription factor [Actinoplanes sp. NPDC023801]|uniref:response regulator transcription factor n=1 Tax=Actinoplanes sp. NPDC023801 TaxID=3154595 RepID=UPI0033BFB83B